MAANEVAVAVEMGSHFEISDLPSLRSRLFLRSKGPLVFIKVVGWRAFTGCVLEAKVLKRGLVLLIGAFLRVMNDPGALFAPAVITAALRIRLYTSSMDGLLLFHALVTSLCKGLIVIHGAVEEVAVAAEGVLLARRLHHRGFLQFGDSLVSSL